MEEWRPIKNWESLYEVSNLGRIRSLDKYITHWRGDKRLVKGKVLRQFERKRYLNVNLCINYNRLCANVHRLVCEAFHPNTNNLPVINHKDGNSLNNKADNLEWCTISYNTQHAWDNGRFNKSRLFLKNR